MMFFDKAEHKGSSTLSCDGEIYGNIVKMVECIKAKCQSLCAHGPVVSGVHCF